MTKTLLCHGFKEYVEKCSWKHYLYCTDNQIIKRASSPTAKLTVCFNSIQVFDAPNMVRLSRSGERDSLQFSNVRSVEVDEGSNPLGTILYIHCNTAKKFGHDIVHTIVAS